MLEETSPQFTRPVRRRALELPVPSHRAAFSGVVELVCDPERTYGGDQPVPARCGHSGGVACGDAAGMDGEGRLMCRREEPRIWQARWVPLSVEALPVVQPGGVLWFAAARPDIREAVGGGVGVGPVRRVPQSPQEGRFSPGAPAPGFGPRRERRRVGCSTNAMESVNAHIGEAVGARGHVLHGQAALRWVYLAAMALDPTGKDRARWTHRWKAAPNAFGIAFDGRLFAGRR